MRGLTIIQPYPYAIVHLDKRIENRGVRPPEHLIGERIAIHSGMKKPDRDAIHAIEGDPRMGLVDESKLVLGAVVGTAHLAGWAAKKNGEHVGSIRGKAADLFMLDKWWTGPVGLVLLDVFTLATPVPCRGMLGFWNVPADVEIEICRQHAAAHAPMPGSTTEAATMTQVIDLFEALKKSLEGSGGR